MKELPRFELCSDVLHIASDYAAQRFRWPAGRVQRGTLRTFPPGLVWRVAYVPCLQNDEISWRPRNKQYRAIKTAALRVCNQACDFKDSSKLQNNSVYCENELSLPECFLSALVFFLFLPWRHLHCSVASVPQNEGRKWGGSYKVERCLVHVEEMMEVANYHRWTRSMMTQTGSSLKGAIVYLTQKDGHNLTRSELVFNENL